MSAHFTRQCLRRAHQECAGLAHWWLQEMREACADVQQRCAPGKPLRTIIHLTAAGGRITQHWRDGRVRSADFQRDANGDLCSQWRDTLPRAAVEQARVHIVLPQSAVLLRRVWLPAAAERNLEAVIDLQLERALPVARAQVQVDWHIESRNPANTRLAVLIALVRCDAIARLLQAMQRQQLRVVAIGVEMGAERVAFNFAPRSTDRARSRLARVDRWLAASAAALSLLLAAVVSAQWLQERIVVAAALEQTRVPARRVERMQARLAEQREPLQTLLASTQAVSTAQVLADLTSAVPADSWLPLLEIRNLGHSVMLKLTVITPSGALLVDRLEAATHFDHVELQSSSAAGLATPQDRVELTARWVRVSTATTDAAHRP